MSIAGSFREKEIVVCVGSGGVGKTTTAAALALRAASEGRRVLVLTIDPAKRLANSLGLSELGNEERLIPSEVFQDQQIPMKGVLSAMMLDTKRTFDDLIKKYAPSDEIRDGILENAFYRNLSSSLAGSHEYLAMEKLYELHHGGRYDLIVLDTPPTKHALDFLEAPGRLADFLDKNTISWFLKPYFAAGRAGVRAFNRGGAMIFSLLEKVTGVEFLKDVSDFFLGFNHIFGDFRERSEKVFKLLQSEAALFVLVTTPDTLPFAEARFFFQKLMEFGMPFGGFIVNKMHADFLFGPGSGCEEPAPSVRKVEVLRRKLEIELESERYSSTLMDALLENFRNFETLSEIDRDRLRGLMGSLDMEVPLVTIPFFEEDIYDLPALMRLGGYIMDGEEGAA